MSDEHVHECSETVLGHKICRCPCGHVRAAQMLEPWMPLDTWNHLRATSAIPADPGPEEMINTWFRIFGRDDLQPWNKRTPEVMKKWKEFFYQFELRIEPGLTLRWRTEVDRLRQEVYGLRKQAGVRRCTCGVRMPHGACSHENGCPLADVARGGMPPEEDWKARAEAAERRVLELQGNYGDGFKAGMAAERNDVVRFLCEHSFSDISRYIERGAHSSVKTLKQELTMRDWTTDKEGRANSSELFNLLVNLVGRAHSYWFVLSPERSVKERGLYDHGPACAHSSLVSGRVQVVSSSGPRLVARWSRERIAELEKKNDRLLKIIKASTTASESEIILVMDAHLEKIEEENKQLRDALKFVAKEAYAGICKKLGIKP